MAARLVLRRLSWVGPATVALAVAAVALVQRMALALVQPIPPAFRFPMTSIEPLVIAALLVVAAVVVFAIMAEIAIDPIRTYRRTALVTLVISFVPNVVAALSWGSWQSAVALAVMHVAAWAVTVTMLTRLGVVRSHADTVVEGT
jgi:hypothetical protein